MFLFLLFAAMWSTRQLRTRLTQAWEHSALPEEELLDFVARIQREVTETLRDTLEG